MSWQTTAAWVPGPCPTCNRDEKLWQTTAGRVFCPGCGAYHDGIKAPWGARDFQHPDPWMDNEPGSLTLPSHWGAMTVPQEMREWQKFNPQHEIVHQFDDGWSVRRARDNNDVYAVGTLLRNCWRGKGNDPATSPGYHWMSLHDQHGLPRTAFFVEKQTHSGYDQDWISGARGRNNNPINGSVYNRLVDYAKANGIGYDPPHVYTFHPDAPYHDPTLRENPAEGMLEYPDPWLGLRHAHLFFDEPVFDETGKALSAEGATRISDSSDRIRAWRDHRKWGNLTPEQQFYGHMLKKYVPNTKYGNALIPWLFREVKKGNLTLDDDDSARMLEDWKGHHESLAKSTTALQDPSLNPTDKNAARDDIEYRKDQLDSMRRIMNGEYVYSHPRYYAPRLMVPHWVGHNELDEPEHDVHDNPSVELDAVLPQIIDAQKAAKRSGGREVNPMQFNHPKEIRSLIDKLWLEKNQNSGKVIHQFDNGWSIRQLMKPEDCEFESRFMDHCVKDYGYRTPKAVGRNNPSYVMHMFSLRDPKNKPHVTWQVTNGGYGEDSAQMADVYGKGNTPPKGNYKAALKEFHDSLPPGHRPISEGYSRYNDRQSIDHHRKFGEPQVDEYGAIEPSTYDWDSIVESAYTHPPTGRARAGYYPENIQKIIDQANASGQLHGLSSAVNAYARKANEAFGYYEKTPALEAMLQTPWPQTLAHFQAQLPHVPQNVVERYPDALGRAQFGQPRPAFASVTDHEHIGHNGKRCNCPYGEGRPSWDPEWEFHTNWLDEDDLTPLAIHLTKLA